jgi:iron complex outermembrane recepter protein
MFIEPRGHRLLLVLALPRRDGVEPSPLPTHGVTLNAFLRYVGAMPEPRQPEYYELSARLAWQVTPKISLALKGFNLLHDRHREYPAPTGKEIERSVFAEAHVSF